MSSSLTSSAPPNRKLTRLIYYCNSHYGYLADAVVGTQNKPMHKKLSTRNKSQHQNLSTQKKSHFGLVRQLLVLMFVEGRNHLVLTITWNFQISLFWEWNDIFLNFSKFTPSKNSNHQNIIVFLGGQNYN